MDPADPRPFVPAVVSWRRQGSGTTAVLRRNGDQGWEEVGRTEATELRLERVDPVVPQTFAAAPVLDGGLLSPEPDWEVASFSLLAGPGAPALPEAPSGFAVAQDGPTLNGVWAPAPGGVEASFELRVGDTWEDGVLVARDLRGASHSWPWWASGDQTFHLKAQDRFGRYSTAAASFALAVEALVDHVAGNTWDHSAGGAFPGTKVNLEVVSGALQLVELPLYGDGGLNYGDMADVPCYARLWPQGTYTTADLDLGQEEFERLEVDLGTSQPLAALLLGQAGRHLTVYGPGRRRLDGSRTPLGTRAFAGKTTFGGAPYPPVDAVVEVDTAPGGGGPVWDGWRPYAPGRYRCRWVRFRVTVYGDGLRQVQIPRLVLKHRRLNKKDEGVVALPGGAPQPVVFAVPFVLAPVVTANIDGFLAAGGETVEITARTNAGFNVEVFDVLGTTSIACNVAWHALGP